MLSSLAVAPQIRKKISTYTAAQPSTQQHQLTQPAKIEWAYKNIMLQAFAGASAWLAEKTGVEGALGYAVVVGLAIIGHFVMNHVDNQRYEAAAREGGQEGGSGGRGAGAAAQLHSNAAPPL